MSKITCYAIRRKGFAWSGQKGKSEYKFRDEVKCTEEEFKNMEVNGIVSKTRPPEVKKKKKGE